MNMSGDRPDDAELCDRLHNIADAMEDDEGELYDEKAFVPIVTPDTQAIHEAAARITALRGDIKKLTEALLNLADACEASDALNRSTHLHTRYGQARAAIAKATGETP